MHIHSKDGNRLGLGVIDKIGGCDSPTDSSCPLPVPGDAEPFPEQPPKLEPASQPDSVPQVMRHDSSSILELDGKEVSVFTPSQPREKWQRKRTHVKLRVRSSWCLGPTVFILFSPMQSEAMSHCCEPSYSINEE